MSDTTSKDDELKPSNSGELKRYFEANFLDGETLQKGQLVSAIDVFEFIKQHSAQEHDRAIEEIKKAGYGYDNGTGFVLKISFAELTALKLSRR